MRIQPMQSHHLFPVSRIKYSTQKSSKEAALCYLLKGSKYIRLVQALNRASTACYLLFPLLSFRFLILGARSRAVHSYHDRLQAETARVCFVHHSGAVPLCTSLGPREKKKAHVRSAIRECALFTTRTKEKQNNKDV